MRRLIDADALSDWMKDYGQKCIKGEREISLMYVWKHIQDMLTIEERKTGKWIIKDNPGTGWYRVTCSECGEDVTSTAPCIGFYPNAKVTWDYCPNCGADMRGEEDANANA